MKKTMKTIMAAAACILCFAFGAAAESAAPALPDFMAYADGRLTQTEQFTDDKSQMIYCTGSWEDVKYAIKGYFDLIKSQYNMTEDVHFRLEYEHNEEKYDYFVYAFSYSGPEGNTVKNMHMGTSSWDISGSDLVLCYSQGRPENENVHFGFSRGFALADNGERVDPAAVDALVQARTLPDIEAYSGGLVKKTESSYWKGGGNSVKYTGAEQDVLKVMESYIGLMTNAYAMEQTDRVEWEHGHKHIVCAFTYTGEDAEDLSTMKQENEEAGMNITGAHVILSYQQSENEDDTLTVSFFEQDFMLRDTAERMAGE